MKKQIIATVLASLIILAGAGCSPSERLVTEGNNVKTYEQLYNGNAVAKYAPVTGAQRYRASYGYVANDMQGYNGWHYLCGTALDPMHYSNGVWEGNGARFRGGVMQPGGGIAALRFEPPLSGKVTVSGTFRMAEAGGQVSMKIMQGTQQVYPVVGEISVSGDDLVGTYFCFMIELTTIPLDFVITGNGAAYCNPTVDYTNSPNDTLYDVPEWGYYGDLHAYYYKDRVNLYHLRNLGANKWEWYLDATTDMFRYERLPYDVSFVQNHYMAYAGTLDVKDYTLYPDGGRDCTMFWDDDIKAYRYIGLMYRNSRTGDCDLAMRTSKTGNIFEEWGDTVVLRDFSGVGEPECSAFRKIGNIWFLYAGISSQSVHGVGGLTYWKGLKGATIDETNWACAESYRLDGEDLAVPQIEEIGGRWYFYGWMPQKYNAGNWGGYRNLPREVYLRDDGLLGTRIDEMATKLLNRGRLTEINSVTTRQTMGNVQVGDSKLSMTGLNNSAAVNIKPDSTFVTFRLDMKNSSRAGYIMQANGYDYYAYLIKRDGGAYLQIGCPGDPSHPVSSEVYLGSDSETVFDCKIVTDGVWQNGLRNGANVEFCVNDKIVLSGRLALDMSAGYTPVFYSDANAEFENITINRLAQKYDIYD